MRKRVIVYALMFTLAGAALLAAIIILQIPPSMTVRQYRELASYLELPTEVEPRDVWTWYYFDSPWYHLWVRLEYESDDGRLAQAISDRFEMSRCTPSDANDDFHLIYGGLSARSRAEWNVFPVDAADDIFAKDYGAVAGVSSTIHVLARHGKSNTSVYIVRKGRLDDLPASIEGFLRSHSMDRWELLPSPDSMFCLRGIRKQ